jgi:moderate conductance mechanosensitive channel
MNELFYNVDWQQLANKVVEWMFSTVPSVILILILGMVALKFWSFLISKLQRALIARAEREEKRGLEEEKRINTLLEIVKVTGKVVIWAILIMILLLQINIEVGPLLASLGVLGLAFGFGAQELVRDFVTGFFILLENHIRVGDVAVINGTGGLVENIGLRTTTLRDLSGVVHIFQNGKINSLSNMTKEWSAMVFDIGVAYKEDTDVAVDIIKEVGDQLQNDEDFKHLILEPIEVFGVDAFGDSAVIIKARIKTLPIKQWVVGREFRRRLKKIFDKRDIEIPFPHSKIYWGEPIKVERINNSD